MRRYSLAGLFVGALVVAMALLIGAASAQTIPSIRVIAIDADPSGNTATSLGALNACARTEPGEQVTVDLVVDAVPGPPDVNGMISFQVWTDYPPDILEVSNADYEFLLGASGTFQPFEGLTDALPDRDGRFSLAVIDLAVNDSGQGANVEEGPGVLARITFTARARGLATVSPAVDPSDTDAGTYDAYPAVFSNQNKPYQVETLGSALVAVGQDCPVPPESTPAVQEAPRLPESLVAGGATPTATPADGATEPTPSTGPTGDSEPTPTPIGVTPAQGTGAPDDNGSDIADIDEGDGGIGAGTVVVIAALAVAGAGMALAGGRMLISRRARRAAGPE